jgi:transcriptional regulator of arginine metabolism
MNDTREARLDAIRTIIAETPIPNQEELIKALTNLGYSVTQSSVSRDLTDLRINKSGGFYVLPETNAIQQLGILQAIPAGPNLLVLKTAIGAAPLIGLKIDQLRLSQIIGTISGDDTIFIATAQHTDHPIILKALGLTAYGANK